MTETTAEDRPALEEEQAEPFVFRCTRCRGEFATHDMQEHSIMLSVSYYLKGMTFCPTCQDAVNIVRLPHLEKATDAVVNEVNQYHRDNPIDKPKAPVLGIVDTPDKGEVH